jgi:hypothetical protein
MHLPAPVYVLEMIAMVGDAADPESGAELRADVAPVVEALKAVSVDRPPRPSSSHRQVGTGAGSAPASSPRDRGHVVLVHDPGSETGVDISRQESRSSLKMCLGACETPGSARLGARRSLVQIQSPRLKKPPGSNSIQKSLSQPASLRLTRCPPRPQRQHAPFCRQ